MTTFDETYRNQRRRLTQLVARAAAATITPTSTSEQAAAAQHAVPIVKAGQTHMVQLVGAYMTAKTIAETGNDPGVILDPARYTTEALRGLPASEVYQRPFTVYSAALERTDSPEQALASARAQVKSLAMTDLQLAQTHSARDWMSAVPTIVGYRRTLTGPGPHCPLCELASTRTYRKADLMPIHEHCGCTVEPLWGTEPVASAGTTVRVELDPELGPRLMADTWSPVGPRLT